MPSKKRPKNPPPSPAPIAYFNIFHIKQYVKKSSTMDDKIIRFPPAGTHMTGRRSLFKEFHAKRQLTTYN